MGVILQPSLVKVFLLIIIFLCIFSFFFFPKTQNAPVCMRNTTGKATMTEERRVFFSFPPAGLQFVGFVLEEFI